MSNPTPDQSTITQRTTLLKDDNGYPTEVGNFVNITAAAPTTTVVKTGAGFLYSITFNKTAANGVVTVYNNTAASGTAIATITSPATLLQNQFTLIYNASFDTGLTILTATAAQDITVTYR